MAESLQSLGRLVHLMIERVFRRQLNSLPSSESVACSIMFQIHTSVSVNPMPQSLKPVRPLRGYSGVLFARPSLTGLTVTTEANVRNLGSDLITVQPAKVDVPRLIGRT